MFLITSDTKIKKIAQVTRVPQRRKCIVKNSKIRITRIEEIKILNLTLKI